MKKSITISRLILILSIAAVCTTSYNVYAAGPNTQIVVTVLQADGTRVSNAICTIVLDSGAATYTGTTNPHGDARVFVPATYTLADISCTDGIKSGTGFIFVFPPRTTTTVVIT